MSDEQLKELQQLREELRQLRVANNQFQQRLYEVSRKLDEIAARQSSAPLQEVAVPPPLPPPIPKTESPVPPVEKVFEPLVPPPQMVGQLRTLSELPSSPPQAAPNASGGALQESLQPAAAEESFEVRLGTYWLPRIGMAALLTGMVFFAAYITPRLTVPQKVAVGYLACVVLGGLGLWLEKRMPQFGRILQAGSLALAYFVTYAAHFVEAFRVIHSPVLALTLLTLVVITIVGVAQERQSATLGGMALFFGYYTSVISGVTGFTLAANAVLALAALFFLARNRWVHISYGAVLATYLTYMIWVWKLNRFGDLGRLVFDSAYLGESDFRLRAAFLSLYWLLFAIGGLLVGGRASRDDGNAAQQELSPPSETWISVAERNGLLTLNNAFFFVLFTLLMHHARPDLQWRFQFCFGGALLVSSAIAYRRFQPERVLMDTLFVQGLGVATLGLISYFKGVKLVAALALESAFVLTLARAMKSRWVAWVGRAAFAVAAAYAWGKYPDEWDTPMIWGVAFAAAVGLVCARLEKRPAIADEALPFNPSSLYFALVSTMLAMVAARQHFGADARPWAWTAGAVLIALIGGALRTREIGWSAHLPLVWANVAFYSAKFNDEPWPLGRALALVAVTLGFGVFLRRRIGKATELERSPQAVTPSAIVFAPYALVATAAAIVTTVDHAPERWLLSGLAAETLLLVLAAVAAREGTYAVLSLIPLATGSVDYLLSGKASPGCWWANALVAVVLLCIAERAAKAKGEAFQVPKELQRLIPALIVVAIAALAVVTLRRLAAREFLTASWAVCGFALLALGFAAKERSYRVAGLIVLGLSLGRALLYDLAQLEVVYRILSFIGLGVILLVLAFLYTKNREKIAKWL
jgi:hypothetical protein